jgi:hypothetical protein
MEQGAGLFLGTHDILFHYLTTYAVEEFGEAGCLQEYILGGT